VVPAPEARSHNRVDPSPYYPVFAPRMVMNGYARRQIRRSFPSFPVGLPLAAAGLEAGPRQAEARARKRPAPSRREPSTLMGA
jgi:hypothetical protein